MAQELQAVACKETERQFIAFEKDIEYYNKSIDRLNGISQLDKRMKDSGIQTIFDYGVEAVSYTHLTLPTT